MRIPGVNPKDTSGSVRKVLESQQRKWGEPLANHLVYASLPDVFIGAQSMWRGLEAAGKIEPSLAALVNRRVAILNGCVF